MITLGRNKKARPLLDDAGLQGTASVSPDRPLVAYQSHRTGWRAPRSMSGRTPTSISARRRFRSMAAFSRCGGRLAPASSFTRR